MSIVANMAPERSQAPAATLWSVLLAAGGSTRLGRTKQLVRFRNRPLVAHAAALAEAATPGRVVVVLGAEACRLRHVLRQHAPRAEVVVNGRWRDGMGSSLAAGLGRLPSSARAALILLVDQPRVTSASLAHLVACWRRRPALPVAARYGERVGVPAILPRRLFGAARRLEGDAGARTLLRTPSIRVVAVPMPEAAIDVDTQRDVSALGRG